MNRKSATKWLLCFLALDVLIVVLFSVPATCISRGSTRSSVTLCRLGNQYEEALKIVIQEQKDEEEFEPGPKSWDTQFKRVERRSNIVLEQR